MPLTSEERLLILETAVIDLVDLATAGQRHGPMARVRSGQSAWSQLVQLAAKLAEDIESRAPQHESDLTVATREAKEGK